jgi:phosphoesterase RecJ-like protein
MSDALQQEINQRIQAAQRVLVVSHIRPDGDAVGSLLGFGLALQQAGKQVQMVLADGVPVNFRHLPGSQQVVHKPEGIFDLVVVVDCSDLKRAGSALNGFVHPDLNIDHHITNLKFAKINLVNPRAVATSEIIAKCLPDWGLTITQPVAANLLTGLITDTLGFRTSNMTPEALRLAARLMETGVDLPVLYGQALAQRSFEAVRFWGAGLQHLEREDSLVWTTLTLEDRQAAGYGGRDDADLINVLSSIQDANIAVIFVEQPNRSIKVSWRAQPGLDVSQIAFSFGGGGHPAAAGAEIQGELDEVRQNVIQATRNLLMQFDQLGNQ